MSIRIAINGLGRIGRTILKLFVDEPSIELVAVNDLTDVENLAYLLRFDTVYGRYSKPVGVDGVDLVVAGRKLRTLSNRAPLDLPWKELGVELVFECTGAHTRREDLEKHVRAGARIVLLSAPSKGEGVETVVHGVNVPGGAPAIISCASCTTNCITPIVEVVGRRIGFEKAVMTTMHAYTSSQSIVDGPSKRFRRGRAAAANLVPAATGAAHATTHALPQYAGRFDGVAIRALIPVGSIADLTFVASRTTTVDEVNQILTEEADTERYAGVMGVSHDPLVSSDIVSVSRAPHLRGASVPITVRFSDFAGVPTVPDGDPLASPRGMAIKFHLPGGIETDVVAQSYDGFPVRTAEEFLVFVRALAASGPELSDPAPLASFLASHPQAKLFAEAPKPPPASFATESYYGVNAFRFTNREGASRDVRYRVRPEAGEEHLDAAEAARRPGSFLFEALAERLVRGPARFHLLVQLADKGDPVGDGSLPWPEGRPQVELGAITVSSPVADNTAAERRLLFDPARLVDGIELSEDPLPLARSAVYAIAYRRRNV